jgi:hypothetical protein
MSSTTRTARVALQVLLAALVAACGGGGGGGEPAPPPAPGPYTIDGTARFESVPTSTVTFGLNYGGTTTKPIRGATVQLLDGAGQTLATTTTDDQGRYTFTLASSQPVMVRVRAEARRTGSAADYDFTVRDNTDDNEALYVLDSGSFTPVASMTRDVLAGSGWGGSSYSTTRAAGPFAMLDVVYEAQRKIATVAPNQSLPPLKVFWSVNNRPADGDLTRGEISTTFYMRNTLGEHTLYILGEQNVDTDEYDSHVIAHEFGHFLQAAVSRDDSVGGSHGEGDKLDARVAFSEGFANAWSGAVLANPRYADTSGPRQGSGFAFNVGTAPTGADRGWYSESTVQYLVWTAHQDATVGFAPIYAALEALRTSPAFTTIYNFHVALKAAAPGGATNLDSRLQQQQISGSDAYGAGETNSGGVTNALPVYKTHTAALGVAQTYCVTGTDDSRNKLGHHVFVRFTTSNAGSRTLTLRRNAAVRATTDPDFVLLASDLSESFALSPPDPDNPNVETLDRTLPAGTHLIALNDFELIASDSRCFDFTVD